MGQAEPGARLVAVLSAAALALSACAGPRGETEGRAGEEPADVAAVPARSAAPRPPVANPVAPVPVEWEAWPPADAANLPRDAATGELVELTCPPGGMPLVDLARLVSERTGAVIAYELPANVKLKAGRLEWTGAWRVPTSRLVDALRSALHTQGQVLAPMALGGEGTGFVIYDLANPTMKSAVEWVPESRVLGLTDCDGRYIVTVLRIRDAVDGGRLRNALTPLVTQSAGIGRIQDVPGGRALVVTDFAPVVAAMKRVVDEINRTAVPPGAPGGVPPTPAR